MVRRVLTLTVRQARRLVVAVVGGTVLIGGVAMLVLPGPGLLVIPLGLAILATEFVWARWVLSRVTEQSRRVSSVVRRRGRPEA